MEMLTAFTSVLHVPNLSHPEHVLAVLEHSDIFNKGEIQAIGKKMAGKRWVFTWFLLSLHINLFYFLFIYFLASSLASRSCWA